MRAAPLAIAIVLALGLAGCTDFLRKPTGDQAMTVENRDSQPVDAILKIATIDGGVPVFSQEVFLEQRQTREFVVKMSPGDYVLHLTTTNKLQEDLPLTIPSHRDAKISIIITRGQGQVTVTG